MNWVVLSSCRLKHGGRVCTGQPMWMLSSVTHELYLILVLGCRYCLHYQAYFQIKLYCRHAAFEKSTMSAILYWIDRHELNEAVLSGVDVYQIFSTSSGVGKIQFLQFICRNPDVNTFIAIATSFFGPHCNTYFVPIFSSYADTKRPGNKVQVKCKYNDTHNKKKQPNKYNHIEC